MSNKPEKLYIIIMIINQRFNLNTKFEQQNAIFELSTVPYIQNFTKYNHASHAKKNVLMLI